MTTLMLIAGFLFLATTLYSFWLESLKKSYKPDWTWLTVMGGNLLIAVAYLACQLAMPMSGIDAFLLLLAVNVVAGTPIVIWQIRQIIQRNKARKDYHGSTSTWGETLD